MVPSLQRINGAQPMAAMFPPAGLEVGQSFDAMTSFPTALHSPVVPPVPVHTTFDRMIDGGNGEKPAARTIQKINVPLDTGWPIRDDGVIAYSMTVTSQKQQQSADVRMEIHMVMDDQAPADN
jgi:hypothetical protein